MGPAAAAEDVFPAISPLTVAGIVAVIHKKIAQPLQSTCFSAACVSVLHEDINCPQSPASLCGSGKSLPAPAPDIATDLPPLDLDALATSPPSKESKSFASSVGKEPKCNKCDGPHATDACPYFKKDREQHKDAWVNYGKKHPRQMGGQGGNFILKHGKCVRQPGDGSCLFHSLSFSLNHAGHSNNLSASELRRELARFIEQNPDLEIAGDKLEEWIRWDANCSVSTYARNMSCGGWGGGIEMAACSHLKEVNVHVYESRWFGGYKRISCFDCPQPTQRTLHVLYQGGVHYDALVPE